MYMLKSFKVLFSYAAGDVSAKCQKKEVQITIK